MVAGDTWGYQGTLTMNLVGSTFSDFTTGTNISPLDAGATMTYVVVPEPGEYASLLAGRVARFCGSSSRGSEDEGTPSDGRTAVLDAPNTR